MSLATIPFGRLLPDRAPFRLNGETRARNVVPIAPGSYGPLRTLSPQGTALAARCVGAGFSSDQNNHIVYAATSTKLYSATTVSNFVDRSKVGNYSFGSTPVEFVHWQRNNKIIATNINEPAQSAGINGLSTFADMITSTLKPKAKHIGIIGNFVVLGNTQDATDSFVANRVWWSAFGDETDFDPDAATQCDFENLNPGGDVQKIVSGKDYGLIFQRNLVQTMRYTGGGTVFEFYPLNYAPGTPIPNSVVAHEGRTFYIADGGFYVLSGGNPEPIGTSAIDRFFWDQFDMADLHGVFAAIDPINKIVVWAFAGTGASTDVPNKALAFKWDEGRWADWEIDVELLFTCFEDNTGGIHRQEKLVAFGTDHKLAFFTGATRVGTIITGDIQPRDGQRWQLNGARPLVDGGLVDISSAPRTALKDAVTFGTANGMNADGVCPLRSEGRYQRVQNSITSSTSWSHFQGIEIDYELEGEH